MTPFIADPDFTLYVGDAHEVLRQLPAGSVDCCVTSPPYWGLRDYGAAGQLGLEATPQEYVDAIAAVFAEVRRVLADEGTLWLNLGDSYSHSGDGPRDPDRWPKQSRNNNGARNTHAKKGSGVKAKDLIAIPWRVAFALQADGWYLRSDIVWSKPNPMPESVTDRPTKSHEYVFLLSKAARYFYDADAIAEPANFYGPNGMPQKGPHAGQMRERAGKNPTWAERKEAGATRGNLAFDGNVGAGTQRGVHGEGVSHDLGDGLTRNARSVWTIQTQPYADAYFAVFPEELPRRCILAGCPEIVCPTHGPITGGPQTCTECERSPRRGVVLDPFMGSGTTALVARKHGRRSIGIELNPFYAELAAKRLDQQSLLAEGAV